MPDYDPDQTVIELHEGQRVFARYDLRAFAGRGGMGVVWRAWDEKLEREVALKFLPDQVRTDPEAVRDLKRETKRCLELTHPHIVRVYDFVEDARAAAIAMEFVDGESLAKRKATAPAGCLAAAELAPLVAQLCAALDYAHAKARVAHRDLKPANLLVTRDGDLKVTDFGIARSLTETRTRLTRETKGGTSGTLPYMSPQQLAGDPPTASDDLYALGATLYELLTGKPPFYRGDGFTLMKQIAERAPAPLAQHRVEAGCDGAPIPPGWEQTILACLAKDAAHRPRTAADVAARLGLAGAPSVSITAPPIAPVDPDATELIPIPDEAPAPVGPALAAGSALSLSNVPPQSSARLQPALEKENDDERGLKRRATANRRGLWLALAAVLVLLGGLGYYFGSYAPEQHRLAAEREKTRQAELAQQAEAARLERERAAAEAETKRLEQQKILAEQQRLAAARGGIIVTTVPAGAEVTVGALEHGTSPLTVKDVKLGKYPVTIRLAGYEDERREAEVKENEFTPVEATLVRSTGAASLASNPPGLEAEVVGRVAPNALYRQTVKTPAKLEKLPIGDYELTFHRPGWPDQKQTLTVKRNETASARDEFLGVVPDPERQTERISQFVGLLTSDQKDRIATIFSKYRDNMQALSQAELSDGKVAELLRAVSISVRAMLTQEQGTRFDSMRLDIGADAQGPTIGRPWTIPELNLEMVPIAPGTFTMGSENGDSDEKPLTRVTLTQPFWLGKTEVTQREWAAIMGNNPSIFKSENLPVEQVSWEEAMEFCHKLTARERAADRLPEGYVYTLPTEAQWEYACRAGTTGDYAGDLDAMAWYNANSRAQTHAVGTKRANAWGLLDMHGNVWEWCADWYENYPGGSVRDPTGPASGTNRVFRGGGVGNAAGGCRSVVRSKGGPGVRYDVLGFRLALSSVR